NLVALPRELGALTRLRCLDLYDTEIKILPESCINKLCNLEIIDFGFHCKLPIEIRNWPKLREFRHLRSDMMPRGIEKLSSLEVLVSTPFYNCIEELAALKDKTNLRELYLYWSEDRDAKDDDMVLEGLLPHPNLKRLVISRFLGLNFPKWMGSSSSDRLLPNLVRLELSYCMRCENLPALGMLPCLRDLMIRNLDSVKCLGREFYYQQQEEEESTQITTTSSILFPSLVNLRIDNMENLEEW
ncbi:hypothetical protein MKX01_013234, partial [Papaver californicum]